MGKRRPHGQELGGDFWKPDECFNPECQASPFVFSYTTEFAVAQCDSCKQRYTAFVKDGPNQKRYIWIPINE